ncbi:sigma-70 family RNA polymerase sigma factor [Mycobacterium sp. 134]|uniref:sigma-70 family RNA polymerase sigma factor n=1 Tax=Mycobacterium sp. 134 TaxID=3400425 RepID=UPI003AAB6057
MSTPEELDLALDIFLSHRTRLFGIAYRVTGETCCAEDLIQEAWLRWQRSDRANVENPAAFLTTTTTNLAINVIQSARYRREAPTASPLDYLLDAVEDEPMVGAEQTAVVEEMLGLLMARLTQGELAAYVLRKGFEYAYADIAALLRTSVANARQLVRRAQTRLDTGERSSAVLIAAHRRLATAFLAAARTGDRRDLERLLAGDASPRAA